MSKNQNRKLAAILFTDIVGYTSLMQKDEQTASTLLRHFQKQLEEKVIAHHGRIVNFYGDGALCTFPIPIDAVRCAMALQTTFGDNPKTPVRIGIHSGTVTLEGDKIFGDSVNLASRIESLGVASAILISKKVRDEVKNNPDLKLQSLGSFEFKNVEEPMEAFALANEGFAVPRREEMQGKLTKRTTNKRLIFISTLVGLLALVALWFGLSKSETAYTPNDKSIAVLPFKDMSQQQDQEYFSDGVAEEILIALSQLEDLKVAGRISSFSFKNKKEISISEIGQQLNVSTILNGSVRKSGDRIRVTANLVDAANGFQIWSEVYDEELKDIFSVQEKIARNIVQKFQLSHPLEAKQLLADQTSNLEAYEQYLKGKFYMSKTLDGLEPAQQAYENAIQLDSNYALAYEGLAEVYWAHSIYGLGDGEEAFKNMKMAAEKTIALNPQRSRGYKYLGIYYSLYELNWLKGMEYIKKSIELNPYDGEAHNFIPVFYGITNDNVERAVKFNEEIVAKDPLSIEALLHLNRAYLWTGKYDKVIENAKRVFELNPKQRSNMRHISEAYLFSGQPEKAIVYTEQMIQNNNYAYYDYILNLVQLDRMEEAKAKFNTQKNSLRALYKALCFFALKEPDKGFEYFEQARLENDPLIFLYKTWLPINAYKDDPRFKAFEAKLYSKPLKD